MATLTYKEYVLLTLQNSPHLFSVLSDEFSLDVDVNLCALKYGYTETFFSHVNPELTANSDFVLRAIETASDTYKYLSVEQQQNDLFILKTLEALNVRSWREVLNCIAHVINAKDDNNLKVRAIGANVEIAATMQCNHLFYDKKSVFEMVRLRTSVITKIVMDDTDTDLSCKDIYERMCKNFLNDEVFVESIIDLDGRFLRELCTDTKDSSSALTERMIIKLLVMGEYDKVFRFLGSYGHFMRNLSIAKLAVECDKRFISLLPDELKDDEEIADIIMQKWNALTI